MIDLKEIEKDIDALKKALQKRSEDYRQAKEANMKEQFGEDFGCHNCAYSCCVYVGDGHTDCTKGHCIYCHKYCDEYMPNNELGRYIEEHHYYDERTLDTLNDIFDVSDIMKHPELYQTALEILKLRDKKENENE